MHTTDQNKYDLLLEHNMNVCGRAMPGCGFLKICETFVQSRSLLLVMGVLLAIHTKDSRNVANGPGGSFITNTQGIGS